MSCKEGIWAIIASLRLCIPHTLVQRKVYLIELICRLWFNLGIVCFFCRSPSISTQRM